MFTQQRFKSESSVDAFGMQCFLMRTTKTLIKQLVWIGWLESSLDVHVRRYVFSVKLRLICFEKTNNLPKTSFAWIGLAVFEAVNIV